VLLSRRAGFVAASVDLVKQGLAAAGGPVRVFSAHGPPEKVIRRAILSGQVERTAQAIVDQIAKQTGGLDWSVCYQSRVGPLKWIGPSTDAEIRRAGADGRSIVLYPLAFVSEHSETLVELDIDYRHLAEKSGVPVYRRVPAVGTHPSFIGGLADRVRAILAEPQVAVCHGAKTMPCGSQHLGCPLIAGAM
jgi:ferrochelatase